MKKNERTFCFYEIKVIARTRRNSSFSPKPLTVEEAIITIFQSPNEAHHPRRAGSKLIYGIDDIQAATDGAKILFYRSDLNEATPSVRDHATEAVRELERHNTEGNSYSSHAIIKYGAYPQEPALLVIEQCAGVGPTRIEGILRQIMRKCKTHHPALFQQKDHYGLKDKDGNVITYDVVYDFEITGIPSNSLIKDLQDGELTAFELIKEGKLVKNFDDEQYFEEKEAVIKLKIADKKDTLKNKYEEINRVLGLYKKDYSSARLRIKPRNSKEYSISWNSSTGFAEDYIKRVLAKGIAPELKSTYKKLHPPLLKRMLSEMSKHA